MQILPCGAIVPCRKIIFADNTCDIENSHPGVVIFPTNTEDDIAYCLYMTSSQKRANREKNNYTPYKGRSIKKSYVNLDNICSVHNSLDAQIDSLDEANFYDLINEFYNYQVSLKDKKPEFIEIEDKVKVLLSLLEIRVSLRMNHCKITKEDIEALEHIKDSNKVKVLYLMQIYEGKTMKKIEDFISSKEAVYYQKLINLYNELKHIDIDKVDISDTNNRMRRIYSNYKLRNHLINIDSLFQDAAIVFGMNRKDKVFSEKINLLLDNEKQREQEMIAKNKEKRKKAEEKQIQEKINQSKAKKQDKIDKFIEKYGKVDDSINL